MSRSRYAFALIATTALLGACSNTTAPRGSGADDVRQVGDRRGKNNDPQPHPSISVLPQSLDISREPEARNEAEARQQAERRREPQPGDDRGNRGGNDDGAGHH